MDIDKLFETMDRETARKMNGTHPPKPKAKAKKKTSKKKVSKKKC